MAAFFISSTEYKSTEFNKGRFAFEDDLEMAKWCASDMLKEFDDVTKVTIYDVDEDCVLTPILEAILPPPEVVFTDIL